MDVCVREFLSSGRASLRMDLLMDVFIGRAEALYALVTGVTSRFSWKRYGCNLVSDLIISLMFIFLLLDAYACTQKMKTVSCEPS